MNAHQDQARWADKQRHEAQSQLEMGLAARTEQWKARLWARKLEQYKVRGVRGWTGTFGVRGLDRVIKLMK